MLVYKTTNLITGKIYVGQTNGRSDTYFGSGVWIKHLISKYGRENFIRETLCECSSQEELNKQEKHWIKVLDSQNPSIGYNIADGGNGHTSKRRQNYSAMSEDQKSKIRDTMISRGTSVGKNNGFHGKNHTQEIKDKISNFQLGRKKSENWKVNMSQLMMGNKRGPYIKSDKQIEKERNK